MHNFVVEQLNIDHAEALRYLHLPAQLSEDSLPDDIRAALAAAEDAVLKAAQPRLIWREFAITERDAAGVHLAGTTLLLPGDDIAQLLAGCDKCILLAATLGHAADELIRRAEPVDMAQALMLDALSGAAVENLCDQLQAALAKHYQLNEPHSNGLHLTMRYSPGYGDLPLSLQRALCATLDTTRRIGLSVSASGILLPRKSVTAVIGLSPAPTAAKAGCHSCDICNMRDNCPYKRKTGVDNNDTIH